MAKIVNLRTRYKYLIIWSLIFVIIGLAFLHTLFFKAEAIYMLMLGFILVITAIEIPYMHFSKNKKFDFKFNNIIGTIYLIFGILLTAIDVMYPITFVLGISSNATMNLTTSSPEYLLISGIIGLSVLLIYLNRIFFQKRPLHYYKKCFAYTIFFEYVYILIVHILFALFNYIPIFVIYIVLFPLTFVGIIAICYCVISIYNLASKEEFIKPKEQIKVFFENRTSKLLGNLVGWGFLLSTGVTYFVNGLVEGNVLLSIGLFFIGLAVFKIAFYVWWILLKPYSWKERLENHYTMMIYAAYLLTLCLIAINYRLTEITEKNTQSSVDNYMLFFQFVIIVVRFVILFFGFHKTRFSGKEKPYYLTLNSLGFVTFLLALYGTIVSIFNKLDVSPNTLVFAEQIAGYITLGLIVIIVIELTIRSLIGLFRFTKYEEDLTSYIKVEYASEVFKNRKMLRYQKWS